mmetsp:Transcript_88376/g.248975  ORF Transcript_88376/g.248975 Transcript_88376/m.248975 type:complete len:326 (+) Transcript_88376:95-1072(+)
MSSPEKAAASEEAPLLEDGKAAAEPETDRIPVAAEESESSPKAIGRGSGGRSALMVGVIVALVVWLTVTWFGGAGAAHGQAVKNPNAGNAKCVSPPSGASDACVVLEAFLSLWDTYDPPTMQQGVDSFTSQDFKLRIALDNSQALEVFRQNVGKRMQENMVDKKMLAFDFGPQLVVDTGSGPAAAESWRQRVEKRIEERFKKFEEGVEKRIEKTEDKMRNAEKDLERRADPFWSTSIMPVAADATTATVMIKRDGKMSLQGLTWFTKNEMSYIMKPASFPESSASSVHNCVGCKAKEIFSLKEEAGVWKIVDFVILKMEEVSSAT